MGISLIKNRLLKWSRALWIRATGRGTLPEYIIIGTQKGGTSSLQRYLEGHPLILSPLRKEIHFFDNEYNPNLSGYQSYFPVIRRNENALVGEASPYYLYHPLVPSRVHQALPNVKLIVLLRDPVDRAFSHYRMQRRERHETLSFPEAIAREAERLQDHERTVRKGVLSWEHQHFSYVDRGKYVDQLERWLEFFDPDQIHVECSEDLFSDTQATLNRIFEFLGVGAHTIHNLKVYNRGKSDDRLDAETRHRLQAIFEPFNLRLFDLLGRTFPWSGIERVQAEAISS